FYAESESEENPFGEPDPTDPNLNRKRAARPEPDESLPDDEPPGVAPVQKLPAVSLSQKLAGLAAPTGEQDLRASPSELLDSAMAAQAARRRKRMATIAVALGLVGVVGLAFAVRRMGGKGDTGPEARRDLRPDPAARTIDGALRKYEEPRRSDPPAPRPAPAPAPPPVAETTPATSPDGRQLEALEEEDITAYEPPDRSSAAFLTILSDMPATVTIDGFRVKKTTPLFKFPVEPGTRRITIEAIGTQERRTLELTFEKGKLQRLDERFRRPQ
ncbi:MAG TPA: hypothetical protein VK420_11775, partial [Longimicrobium sp.]|nr:hypothetical protein [Longimicrobium sp.]